MNNSNFSSLIYRIIGKPERWHDDHIDFMHQILDETRSFDDPQNIAEVEIGDQILNRLKMSNEALVAFSTVLDKSRFKMVLLDANLAPIYHNKNASSLHQELLALNDLSQLNPSVLRQIRKRTCTPQLVRDVAEPTQIRALDLCDKEGNQIYFRPIRNRATGSEQRAEFNLLMVLDQNQRSAQLNAEFINTYELTDKEQMVLLQLIGGHGISQIAQNAFVSENTIKTHLKSLFRKTDTNSQTEVIRLVLTHESQILDSYFDPSVRPSENSGQHNQDRFLCLDDGLKIAYREYGSPAGHPVIVFHNGYGCRLAIPPTHESACAQGPFRVLIPDRPGFGRTPVDPRGVAAWPTRVNEFVSKLGITRYDVLGNVLGCPLAIAHASQADERLQRLILSSPILLNSADDGKYLSGILAPTARLVQASKHAAREIYRLWLKSMTLNLEANYRSMLESSFTDAEGRIFREQGVCQLMIDGFREGCSKTLEGIVNEMVFALSPQHLNLRAINIPVELWWGSTDNRVTQAGVEALAEQFPNSQLRVCEGYSEHIYYAKLADMLRGLSPCSKAESTVVKSAEA